MSLLVSFEVALAIIETVMFAVIVYEMFDKRKKLKTSIAVAIFVMVSIIISLFCNSTFCGTFEIHLFVSAFLISTSLILIIFLFFIFLLPKLKKRKPNVNNSREKQEANELRKEIYGGMYADGQEDNKENRK